MIDPIPVQEDPAADEARFWGQRQTPEPPDHRLRKPTASPQELWEDPEVEAIARGRFVERILGRCEPPGLQVLELACGCGWLALELARHGHHVHGIDISPERLRSARDYAAFIRVGEHGLGNLEYEVGDLNQMELPAAAYDRVVCWDGLHHIASVDALMMSIRRALRPGGLVLLFDHIGPAHALQEMADRAIAFLVLCLFQPRRIPGLLRGKGTKERAQSEDVSARRILPAVVAAFGRENVQYETTMATGKRWLARIRGPRAIRLSAIRLLCRLDRLAIRCRLARGEYIYLEAEAR